MEDEYGFPLEEVRYNCIGCKQTFSDAKHLCQRYFMHAIYKVPKLKI